MKISKKAAKTAFAMGPIIRELQEAQPAIGNQFQVGYVNSIDLGGHPNYLAFLMNLVEREDGKAEWQYVSNDPGIH